MVFHFCYRVNIKIMILFRMVKRDIFTNYCKHAGECPFTILRLEMEMDTTMLNYKLCFYYLIKSYCTTADSTDHSRLTVNSFKIQNYVKLISFQCFQLNK